MNKPTVEELEQQYQVTLTTMPMDTLLRAMDRYDTFLRQLDHLRDKRYTIAGTLLTDERRAQRALLFVRVELARRAKTMLDEAYRLEGL